MQNIKLKGAKNIRDLAGLPTDGGVIRPHRLLRGSHLSALTSSDIEILTNEYNLKTVIDLRTEVEKKEKPNVRIDGVEYLEMPIFDDSLPGLSHESKQDLDNVPDLRDLYAQVMQGACLENLAAVIRRIVLSDDGGAVLYHCTEGKDRTGMVTALLLVLLGADRKTILDDYLFTNTINKSKAVKYYLLLRIFKHNKTAANKVYRVFLAKEEYISEVFRAVDRAGEERFINEVLKLSREDINAFKKRIIQA